MPLTDDAIESIIRKDRKASFVTQESIRERFPFFIRGMWKAGSMWKFSEYTHDGARCWWPRLNGANEDHYHRARCLVMSEDAMGILRILSEVEG